MDRGEENHFEESRREERGKRKEASRKDRSKFKKTDRAKRERLLLEATTAKLNKKDLLRGRVLAILPEEISVDCEGKIYPCVLGGVLKKEKGSVKNLVTVGDFVLFEKEKGLIVHVEPRKSVLSRLEHLTGKKEQLIAANIDQVLITVSVVAPPLKPSLIDRYIIATRKGNMEPVIVINKVDLLENENVLKDFVKTYRSLGLRVLMVSAISGVGMEELKEVMRGKASVFSGQSGVGKSSLINATTGLDLAIGELAIKTQKGSHTTTGAHLIPLACGGWCIDTPGIRSFGMWELKKEDLDAFFPEISEQGLDCKYQNCTHTHEPSCAVRQAVEAGTLSHLRYESYCKLLEEISS